MLNTIFITDKEIDNDEGTDPSSEIIEIREISSVDGTCVQCSKETSCCYRFTKNSELQYICSGNCLLQFIPDQTAHYNVVNKKFLIEEIEPKALICSECEEKKMCYFYYNYDGEDTNYCSLKCLDSMMGDEKEKYKFRRRIVHVMEQEPTEQLCISCNKRKKCNYFGNQYGESISICSVACVKDLNQNGNRYVIRRSSHRLATTKTPLLKLKVISNATDKYLGEAQKIQSKTPAMIQAREDRERSFIRKCAHCSQVIILDDKSLVWETMDFCNEGCLGWLQNKIGSKCANCKSLVTHTSLGKYCVRFGYDIRQFCNSTCLDEFKKSLKICCYCQRDISLGHLGFLAPVGDKRQFKDFCSQSCMEKFDLMSKNTIPQPSWGKCAVCSTEQLTSIEVEVSEGVIQRLCSEPCFAAYKFVNTICPGTYFNILYKIIMS